LRIVAGAVVVAALSLLLPQGLAFDPWAWLVWGRDAGRLALDTTTGPSWKPFPVLFTTLFIAAFAVGEGLYALLGYRPEDATEPLWVALAAGVPALVLFLVPCAAAVWYGSRARAEGHRVALLPLVLGAVLGLWMLVMTTVSIVAG